MDLDSLNEVQPLRGWKAAGNAMIGMLKAVKRLVERT
jgi:hypothetical protein